MARYFKDISPPADTKIDVAAFIDAEMKLLQKAGVSNAALGQLGYRFKNRPPKLTSNTFDQAAFTKGLVEFESRSCEARVQPAAASKEPAPPQLARRGECILGLVLGVGVGVIDTAIGVLGSEVITPYPALQLHHPPQGLGPGMNSRTGGSASREKELSDAALIKTPSSG